MMDACRNPHVWCLGPTLLMGWVVSRRCLEFDDGHEYLSADLRIDCDSRMYREMFAYSMIMFVVIAIGFPLGFFLALWPHRRSLYPMNRDRCVRVRHSPDGATPCIVACVEAQFSSAAREAFHNQLLQLERVLHAQHQQSQGSVVAGLASASASGGASSGGAGGASSSVGGPATGTTLKAVPGPGHPSLQHAGEPMFHYGLPATHAPAQAAVVDAAVRDWHLALGRYDVAVDVSARRNNPSVQHLSFLFEV
jgi:hypothetical protein